MFASALQRPKSVEHPYLDRYAMLETGRTAHVKLFLPGVTGECDNLLSGQHPRSLIFPYFTHSCETVADGHFDIHQPVYD